VKHSTHTHTHTHTRTDSFNRHFCRYIHISQLLP